LLVQNAQGEWHGVTCINFAEGNNNNNGPPSIVGLDMAANALSGSIPEDLYLSTSLRELHLGGNLNLDGAISTRVGLTNLERFEWLELPLPPMAVRKHCPPKLVCCPN